MLTRLFTVFLMVFAIPLYIMWYTMFVAALPLLVVLNGCLWVLTGETWGTHPATQRLERFVVDLVP